jgi:hypothetical protein
MPRISIDLYNIKADWWGSLTDIKRIWWGILTLVVDYQFSWIRKYFRHITHIGPVSEVILMEEKIRKVNL